MIRTAPARPPAAQRGSALLVAIAVLLTAGIFAALFTTSFEALLRETGRERYALAESQAAAGGVEKARAALARDPSWAGGAVAVGRGRAEIAVEAVPGRPEERRVRVIATVPGPGPGGRTAGRRVEAILRIGKGLPAVASWREWGGI